MLRSQSLLAQVSQVKVQVLQVLNQVQRLQHRVLVTQVQVRSTPKIKVKDQK